MHPPIRALAQSKGSSHFSVAHAAKVKPARPEHTINVSAVAPGSERPNPPRYSGHLRRALKYKNRRYHRESFAPIAHAIAERREPAYG